MTPRQQVAQAIREACHELQELKFGCVVEVMLNGHDREIGTIVGSEDDQKIDWGDGRIGVLLEDTISKVIGSPIHLEHVMRAINTVKDKHVEIYLNGGMAVFTPSTDEELGVTSYKLLSKAQYDLSLPFSDQSDELINFLHPILCGKE